MTQYFYLSSVKMLLFLFWLWSFGFMFCHVLVADATVSAVDIQEKYRPSLDLFISMQENDLLRDENFMDCLFLQLDESSHALIARLRADCKILKKAFKKAKKSKSELVLDLQRDYQTLSHIYSYTKKYRLNNDVLFFHRAMQKKWGKFCQLITKDEDILLLLPELGIEHLDAFGLKAFLKIVERDQRKVDEYERRVHTDWIDLKLANYVLKIDLIRVRNAALFHPLLDGVKIKSIYPK